MTPQSLMTLEKLRITHETGGIASVTLQAQGKNFYVMADIRTGARAVLVRSSDRQPRAFAQPGTALKMLHEIGVGSVKVDMSAWEASQEHLPLAATPADQTSKARPVSLRFNRFVL